MIFSLVASNNIGLFIAILMLFVAVWQVNYYRVYLKQIRYKNLSRRDLVFQTRQAGRRLQLHALIGLAGLGMLTGLSLPHHRIILLTVTWFIVILFVLWAIFLALIDFLSIKLYYMGMERQNRVEEIQREYELNQLVREQKEKAEIMARAEKMKDKKDQKDGDKTGDNNDQN